MPPHTRGQRRNASCHPGWNIETVRVRLLGGFQVSVGRIIEGNEWRLRKAASLLKLLALAPNHRLHREQAMETLWLA